MGAKSSSAAAIATAALILLVGAPSGWSPAPVAAEVNQRDGIRISVVGSINPSRLPRQGTAPIRLSVAGRIAAAKKAGHPPRLRKIAIALNRHGHLDRRGLPLCRLGRIDPSTSQEALAACRGSWIGEGRFTANVKIAEQSPFPSVGKILAFNGRLRGKPAIFAHIYGTKPVPTSQVLPFSIRSARGTYGTVLEASLPQVTGEWGYVTGVSLTLGRRFASAGRMRSYLIAGCPAPTGFSKVAFPLARTRFLFEGGLAVTSTLSRTCVVR
jgi:hypothetical protein